MESGSMHEIMQRRIEQFNQFVMAQDIEKLPIGLFDGKMGICIYFYHQARLTRIKEFEVFADKLLESVCNQIHILGEKNASVETGIAGIGLGIIYLIENCFAEGDVNAVLKELDDKIFYHISTYRLSPEYLEDVSSVKFILGLIFYFLIRLESKRLDNEQRILFENIVVKMVNEIENCSLLGRSAEPVLFSLNKYVLPIYLMLLQKMYSLNFYNYKIDKIFNELACVVLSSIPLLQSNRIYLSMCMDMVKQKNSLSGWMIHKTLLDNSIDVEWIVEKEFRNKNIFPNDGLVGCYLLAKRWTGMNKQKSLLFHTEIVTSEAWSEFLSDKDKLVGRIGLVTGFCGVILAYQDILKYVSDENKP